MFSNSTASTLEFTFQQPIASFSEGEFFADNDDGSATGYNLVSLDVALVPIPGAVWLFGSALALLGWTARRAV